MGTKYKLIIFDWEGTLQDSKGMVLTSLKEHVAASGLPTFDEIKARALFSYDPSRLIDDIYRNQLSTKDRVALKLSFQQYYLTTPKQATLFKGASSLLSDLISAGCFVAVATNAGRQSMERALEAVDLTATFFSVKTADEYAQKPSPEMIEALLTESNVSCEQAVMIGDSSSDMKAAVSANIDAIGFEADIDGSILQNCGAKQLVCSMSELREILL